MEPSNRLLEFISKVWEAIRTMEITATPYRPSKNIYWDKLKRIDEIAHLDEATEAHAGSWRTFFPILKNSRHMPLVVDIGCNGAHSLAHWARNRPDAGFIGIDWKFKQIYRGYERIKKWKLENALVFRARAERLDQMFGRHEIDEMTLLFPDPWPKKSQQKNRLVQIEWLHRIHDRVRPDGQFEIRTDHRGYFDHIAQKIHQNQRWKLESLDWDIYQHQLNYPKGPQSYSERTLFEQIHIRERKPIGRFCLRA